MARVSAERAAAFERARSGIGFFAGPLVFLLILLLPTPSAFWREAEALIAASPAAPEVAQLAFGMKVTLALLLLMVIWWVTEAVPIPVTALLPGFILPVFQVVGVQGGQVVELNARAVLAHYANPVIFLFLSGFLIAGAMQKWGVDRRIALWILTRGRAAKSPDRVLLSLMGASAFISMWVSNTATTAMMLPIGLGVLSRVRGASSNYARAMMLGIAYAASIGGVGTIIGTPPNGIAVSILRQQNIAQLHFLEWMSFGVPFVLVGVPLAWLVLRALFPCDVTFDAGVGALLHEERAALGPWGRGEKLTLVGFLLAVVLWTTTPFWSLVPEIGRRLSGLDEHMIALGAAILLFLLPVDWSSRRFVLHWEDSRYVEWGTLLLFGGGIALSDAMFKTGLARVLASEFVTLFGKPAPVVLVLLVVIFMELLTEVTSNTAVTSMMVPILISMASGLGADALSLVLPATIAASMAFMLPVATPPNALVYATRRVTIADMLRAGIVLDLVTWLYIVAFFYGYVSVVLGLVRF
jgi:sodium-dependent dicarboxylate transporter 2/3/5